jgi:hypothetical protein
MNCNYGVEVTVGRFEEGTQKTAEYSGYELWAKWLKLKNKKPLVFNDFSKSPECVPTTDTLRMAILSAAKAALLSIRAARVRPCPDDSQKT